MPSPAVPRWLTRPGLASGALLVATLGTAGGLAYQASRAASLHRAAAVETLSHYSTIAAWLYAREGRSWVGYGMSQALGMIAGELPAEGAGPLPGPELLRRLLAQKECDCVSAGFSRTIFRITGGDRPDLTADGESLSPATQAALIGLLQSDTVPDAGPRRWRILPPGQPALARPDDVVLLWIVATAPPAAPRIRAIYGMVVEAAQIHRPLVGALGDAQFFPPSLIPKARADSLIRIVVAGPDHTALLESGPRLASFPGADTLGWVFGSLRVTASIDPVAANLLIGGGVPASRAPQIIALLTLTLALGGAALLLLRREHHLARLRDDFVSGVSHELRTPLTQIRMLSELLQSDGFHSGAERTRAITVIHREALKLTNLVDNVLQFARLRRARAVVKAEPVDIGEVVAELAESFQPMLAASESRLEVSTVPALRVPGDGDAIARILRNLVENAIKYGPPGQTIRLAAGYLNGPTPSARISIVDQGPGIPRKDRDRIWQPYQRLERDRNVAVGGSGLGLSVVAELVATQGGRAWVEDAADGGACFVVELPGARVDAGGSR